MVNNAGLSFYALTRSLRFHMDSLAARNDHVVLVFIVLVVVYTGIRMLLNTDPVSAWQARRMFSM